MSKQFEDAYWGKEIAQILQIGDSTLRKWCLALENQGYEFMRGQHNSRAFVERDLLILRRMRELIQTKGITLETASEIVISRMNQSEGTRPVPEENKEEEQVFSVVPSVRQNELLLEILERQERLEQQNKQLIAQLEERDRNRDKQLMEALRESQETKKLLVATLEQQKEKKGLLARLFRK